MDTCDYGQERIVSELDHYFMKNICHAAAERLKLQCSREYWFETEEGNGVTAIHMLRPKRRANFFKDKHIIDYLMLDIKGKEESS